MWRKWSRELALAILSRIPFERAMRQSRRGALAAFRRTAGRVPAYQQLLGEAGIDPRDIRGYDDFLRLPLLDKHNTFERFPLHELCLPGQMEQLASVLTSSGQSGRFAFGLTTRRQARRSTWMIDLGLEATFQTDRRRTLLLNALPMGVGFASDAVTIAETSVREDMVLALADRFGPYFEQIVLVTDPLFLKLLCDTSRDRGFDWRRFRVNVVLGEETFGEHYRTYVGRILGTDPDARDGPLIGASLGVAELGLNLFFETRETIALRRAAWRDAGLRRRLFGPLRPEQTPMLYAYSPQALHVEVLPAGGGGGNFGRLALSPLGAGQPLPLLRYLTGDLARFYPPAEVADFIRELGFRDCGWRLPIVAVLGRDQDELPGGTNISELKDCFYRDTDLADHLTGAFRIWIEPDGGFALHIQLRPGVPKARIDLEQLRAALPEPLLSPEARLTPWQYETFPFGMRLDYERKFRYF